MKGQFVKWNIVIWYMIKWHLALSNGFAKESTWSCMWCLNICLPEGQFESGTELMMYILSYWYTAFAMNLRVMVIVST